MEVRFSFFFKLFKNESDQKILFLERRPCLFPPRVNLVRFTYLKRTQNEMLLKVFQTF